jgi:light-regulated signal transduction histidine kinase (bacteriophytochrome)
VNPEDQAKATLNMLEDFLEDRAGVEQTQRAVFNILEDFGEEKSGLQETQSATLNLLEDFDAEGCKMEEMQHAIFNLLEDFSEGKGGLEETQSATLNLLEDFDAERTKAEHVSGELRESIELLQVAKEATEASNRELEAFSYSVSHDLRAPLRHISGFSKILSEEYSASLAPEAQHHLQRIQEGTQRMGQLVDDLLSLARVGRQGLRLQVTSLKPLVEEVISESLPDTAARQVEWKIDNLPFVECDPALMKQVFQNLLSNALKFTRPRSPAVIEIGQENQAGTPVVFVRDNGVGFNMKYSDKLFGVFQRLHRPEDFEGTGVGLATVQRIIQKHSGRIWAEAELDKGAAFFFTLGAAERTLMNTKAAIAGDERK